MAVRLDRRRFLGGTAGAALAAGLPFPAVAQPKPVRIGLLTVKTGPLAQGGIQMEQGTIRFLRDGTTRLPAPKAGLAAPTPGAIPPGPKTRPRSRPGPATAAIISAPSAPSDCPA